MRPAGGHGWGTEGPTRGSPALGCGQSHGSQQDPVDSHKPVPVARLNQASSI